MHLNVLPIYIFLFIPFPNLLLVRHSFYKVSKPTVKTLNYILCENSKSEKPLTWNLSDEISQQPLEDTSSLKLGKLMTLEREKRWVKGVTGLEKLNVKSKFIWKKECKGDAVGD